MATTTRLQQLRVLMCSGKYCSETLSAYVIPTDDQHQSEYIADCDKRRQYISGFTGSAGVAVVAKEKALLWTDGRYHLQASQQLDSNWTLMKQGVPNVPTLTEWLKKEMGPGTKVGYDPALISEELHVKWKEDLDGSEIDLVPVKENLVDKIWTDRPLHPTNSIYHQPLQYAGESWEAKISKVREKMKGKDCAVLVLTALDEIAWLFNLRGSDIEFNPVFFAYSIVTLDSVRLYVSEDRLTPDARQQLTGGDMKVVLRPYLSVVSDLEEIISSSNGKIWINGCSSYGLCSLVQSSRRVKDLCPIQLMKGRKNPTEIQGMRLAHIKCAVALCEYYSWLENELQQGHNVTELSASNKLEEFRRALDGYVCPSFPTISASGPHGAIIHYRPMPETDRTLSLEELYLCDTGCQFRDGTTDVTRTMHFGIPTDKQKECFTLVLKGNIALCTAVFPEKTPGSALDAIARLPLWGVGLNYRHGTGHGVGAFLNVHEGPQGIGGSRVSKAPLYADMIVSDEPGYYEDGEFGIRIENVVLIKKVETKYKFGDKDYLTMEPLTLVPIQLKMIQQTMLTPQEITWLNSYHTRCRKIVGGVLLEQGRDRAYQWLLRETESL